MQTSVLGTMLVDFYGCCGCRHRDLFLERKNSPAGAVVARAKSAACLEARGRVTDDRFCAMVVKCLRQRGMLQEETQVGLILLFAAIVGANLELHVYRSSRSLTTTPS